MGSIAPKWVCLGMVGLALVGCHHHHHEHETVYVDQPRYVMVPTPPPAVIVEPRPHAGPVGQVWIDGYWHWEGGRYAWRPGYWAAPPDRHAIWVAPRYERFDRGYRYIPGHWSRGVR